MTNILIPGLTEAEIINEAFLFYVAGFETSSSAMTFAFIELSQYPKIQEKLRQEIIETLDKYDGKITYDAIMEMEYLDKVIRGINVCFVCYEVVHNYELNNKMNLSILYFTSFIHFRNASKISRGSDASKVLH